MGDGFGQFHLIDPLPNIGCVDGYGDLAYYKICAKLTDITEAAKTRPGFTTEPGLWCLEPPSVRGAKTNATPFYVRGERYSFHDMAALKISMDGMHLLNDAAYEPNLARATAWRSTLERPGYGPPVQTPVRVGNAG